MIRKIIILFWILFGIMAVMILSPLRSRKPAIFVYKILCRLVRVEVKMRGVPIESGHVLYASNHSSYLDIPVLGSILPASFISRHDVAGWPIIGLGARLTGTFFLERTKAKTAKQLENLRRRLSDGSLILFPEGTTTDGVRLGRFHSSFFDMAQGFTIQPVTVKYQLINNLPVSRGMGHNIYWTGDMELVPHLNNLLSLGRITAIVTFHPPITPERALNRKEIAALCEAEVAKGLEIL